MSNFPDPVSFLVDEERRKGFEMEGGHFESNYVLSFCWLPPAESQDKAGAYLIEREDDVRGDRSHVGLNGGIILWPRRIVRLICSQIFCRRSGSFRMKRH